VILRNAGTTVKPLSTVFQGDGKQKRYMRGNDSTGKPLKIIDKNNLMIIIIVLFIWG
jgi:hypothetical protein